MFIKYRRFTILLAALCGLVLSGPTSGRADKAEDAAVAEQAAQAKQARKDFRALKKLLSQANPSAAQDKPAVNAIAQKMVQHKEAKRELQKVEARLVEAKQYLEHADAQIEKLDANLDKKDRKIEEDDDEIAGFDAIQADAAARRDLLADQGRQSESDAVVDWFNEVELPRQQVVIDRRNDLADEYNDLLDEHEEKRLAFNAKLDEIRDLLVEHTRLTAEIRDLDLKLGPVFDQLRQAGVDPAMAAALFNGNGAGLPAIDPPGVPPIGPSGPVNVPNRKNR